MQHLYQTHNDFNLSFQFQVGPDKHNMLKLSFITNVPRWSTFNDKIGNVTFNLRVRVKHRIPDMFLFFCIFRDRDGDSIVENKQEKNIILISYDKAILSH